MTVRQSSLEALFYAAAHADVLKATVDSPDGQYSESDTFLVVGSLVFAGRSDDAATVARRWERTRAETGEQDLEQAAAIRFFLCVSECRSGRYGAAERLCRVSLRELDASSSSRARFYFHQGLGLVRHFTGRIGSAARHAARARRFALDARFPYGRMLALDLLGHALVHHGKVFAGLAVLEQGVDLAEGIGLASFAMTTRSAIVAYRAHFGAGEANPIAALETQLEQVGAADRYSRRLILTELAKAHAFRGEGDAAATDLRRAEDVALPDGDRRAAVKLHLAQALVAALREGEHVAEAMLERARALLEPAADDALAVEIAWYEYLVCPRAFGGHAPEKLLAVAQRTGIARAYYLAAARGARVERLSTDDRFAAALREQRDASGGPRGRPLRELPGLLPMSFGRAPGTRIFIDEPRGLFAVEDHGNVTLRDVPSPSLVALLRGIAAGARTKEALINEVWQLKVYRPEKHDAVVHTAISRLRLALDPHGSWIQVVGTGYALAPDVEVVEATEPVDDPAIVVTATDDPTAPPSHGDPRRIAALELVRAGGAATRDVAEHLKVSDMTAFRLLASLVEEGLIERTGRGRNTRYIEVP